MTNTKADPLVSVIVPTMASSDRAEHLMRAIASIRASTIRPIRIIVVVNGSRFDNAICNWLKTQPDVEFIYESAPSLPGALLKGRQAIHTEFFSTLDDDDEYLPGVTDRKLETLVASDKADLLVGNVIECSEGFDQLRFADLDSVQQAPLATLMRYSWLLSGNALYRSASVGEGYFRDHHPYAEWTWLAFRLAMDGKQVVTLNIPTFKYNYTSGSLSQSEQFFKSYIPLFERMLRCRPQPKIRQMIHRKMRDAFHDASVVALKNGHKSDAWIFHLRSLAYFGGFRYLAYTRHLFR